MKIKCKSGGVELKRTYQPKVRQRKREHGFRKRMFTKSGRLILKKRRQKGREKLSAQSFPDRFFISGLLFKKKENSFGENKFPKETK